MAHGYGSGTKGGGSKFRGGSSEKRIQRDKPKPSNNQDSRKSHDTTRKGAGGKPGR